MNRKIFSSIWLLFFVLSSTSVFCNDIYLSENISFCTVPESKEKLNWLPPVVVNCGDFFFDPGGPDGDFQPGQSQLVTFCPDSPDEFIVLDFSEFDLGLCCDAFLEVHQGESLGFLIHVFDGNFPARVVSGTDPGCITLNFAANLNATPAAGWEAEVTCSACQPPFGGRLPWKPAIAGPLAARACLR